jgi:hypothetical protein
MEGAVRSFLAGYLAGSLIVAAWDRRELIAVAIIRRVLA